MTGEFSGLPSNWRLSRVDRLASVNARIGWKALTAAEYQPEGYAFLSTPNIKSREIDFENVNYISPFRYEESPELKLREGDVLLAKDGSTLGIVNMVRHLPRSATVNGSIALLRAFDIDPGFLRYVLASQPLQDRINATKDGMGVPHLFQRDIKKLPIPVPPAEEQRRIADFLDTEIQKIDFLSNHRSRMRELLALKRERVIGERLGLATNGGKLSSAPLKYVADAITVGIVITPAKWYVDEGGTPALRGLNIKPGMIQQDDLVQISNEGHALNSKSCISAGDVLVVRTGQAGAAAVVPTEFDGANCIDLILIRPGKALVPKYLEYVLNSEHTKQKISEHSVGSIQAHFNVGAMKQLPIPIISREQQEAAVCALDYEIAKFDDITGRLTRQERLLKERRAALITAAVTGQFDVSTASGRGVGV